MSEFGGFLNEENENYDYQELSLKLNPDKPPEKWGCLIHPDEVRKLLMYGNGRFISVNGDTISDYQIKNWIDQTVNAFSSLLNHDIYPRLFRHRPIYTNQNFKDREIEDFAEWEELYDYNVNEAQYHFVKLRHFPVHRVHKWEFLNPVYGNKILDLTPRMTIKHDSGIIRSTYFYSAAIGMGGYQAIPISAFRLIGGTREIPVPGVYAIDYSTGYDKASRVPKELIEQIQKLMIIALSSAYGDGVVAGVANYSTSVSGVSESLGTTMSATSAFMGARIQQLYNELKDWIQRNKVKYTGIQIGVL